MSGLTAPNCQRSNCDCSAFQALDAFGVITIWLCVGCHNEMSADSQVFDQDVRERYVLGKRLEIRKIALGGPCANVDVCDQLYDKIIASEERIRSSVRDWLRTSARHAHAPNAGSPS